MVSSQDYPRVHQPSIFANNQECDRFSFEKAIALFVAMEMKGDRGLLAARSEEQQRNALASFILLLLAHCIATHFPHERRMKT